MIIFKRFVRVIQDIKDEVVMNMLIVNKYLFIIGPNNCTKINHGVCMPTGKCKC